MSEQEIGSENKKVCENVCEQTNKINLIVFHCHKLTIYLLLTVTHTMLEKLCIIMKMSWDEIFCKHIRNVLFDKKSRFYTFE